MSTDDVNTEEFAPQTGEDLLGLAPRRSVRRLTGRFSAGRDDRIRRPGAGVSWSSDGDRARSPWPRRQSGDVLLVLGEHRVHEPIREELIDAVPAQQHAAGVLDRLMVEPDLRGLRSRAVGPWLGGQQIRADTDHAGEHHRHRAHRDRLLARQVAQDGHS